MDQMQFQVPTEDHLDITIQDSGRIQATVDAPEETIKVNVTLIGEPGTGGGGSGVDPVARQKADTALSEAAQAQTALINHQSASQPHKAYDQDIPSLTLIFQNGLI